MARTGLPERRSVRRRLFFLGACLLALFGGVLFGHRLGSEAAAATNVSVTLVDGNQTSVVLPGTPQEAPPRQRRRPEGHGDAGER
jgi:hypothetical protein